MAKIRQLTLGLIVALGLMQNKSQCLAKTADKENGPHDLFSLDEDDMIIPTLSDKDNKPASDGSIDDKTCIDN